MADILKITSAAVESLLSASSSTVSDKSFGKRIRVSGKNVREISIEEILRRSNQTDDGFDIAEFLNNQSNVNSLTSSTVVPSQLQLNKEHRTISPSPNKSVLVGSLAEDQSRHLVAPSTDSSEYISIIDVGQSISSSDSMKFASNGSVKSKSELRISSSDSIQFASNDSVKSKSEVRISSPPLDDIDLVPVKDNGSVSKKNISSSTVSSLKSNEVVDASTPNSKRQAKVQWKKASDSNSLSNGSLELPATPDLSEHPPALPSLNNPYKGLQQGSLDSFKGNEVPIKSSPDVEIKQLSSNQVVSARHVLQGSVVTSKKGSVVIQRHNPAAPAPAATYDQTSQIAAAVAAAVAATTPFYQLKSEIEEKIQKLSAEVRSNSKIDASKLPQTVVINDPPLPQSAINDSLDITIIPDTEDKEMGVPTPVQPRVAPKPRSLRKPQESSKNSEKDSKKMSKLVSAKELRSKFILSDSDSAFQDIPESQIVKCHASEYDAVKEDVIELLNEAKEAKRDIQEMRHAERMHSLRSSVFRNETPADIYLERIREREAKFVKPRYVDENEYRTPDYIIEAKNTLAEIEEKRQTIEEKQYSLNATYLCEEKDPIQDDISKRIDEILDNIQKELKDKDPKKTKVSVDQPKPKRKPKGKSKLEEKKALYNKLKAENQQHKITANIGLLKQQEKQLKTKSFIAGKKFYKSPYQRSELPKSYPLAPRHESSVITSSIEHLHSTPLPIAKTQKSNQTSELPKSYPLPPRHESSLITPSIQHLHSTPLPIAKSQKSMQTSPIKTEQIKPSQYKKPTRDVSVCNSFVSPEMIDQYSSPLKILTHEKAQSYSPPICESREYNHQQHEEVPDQRNDDYIGVVDLPKGVLIPGVKDIPVPRDKFAERIRPQKYTDTDPHKTVQDDDDKVAVMQWLEDEILDKLLTEETHEPDEDGYQNNKIVGDDVVKNIADLGVDISSVQLRLLVSDIIKGQIEERSTKFVAADADVPENASTSNDSRHESDEAMQEYDSTFESSPTSISKSSLSVVPTPSVSYNQSVSVSGSSKSSHVFQRLSPPTTPEPSPDIRQSSSSPVVLPEGVPVAATEENEDRKVKQSHSAFLYDNTIEQVDLSDDNMDVGGEIVPTPELTELPKDSTLSETAGYDHIIHEPLTPLNTVTVRVDPADSLISQQPLGDTGDLSLISQHPLDETRFTAPQQESFGSVSPEAFEESTTSYTFTETTDFPISAGEVLPVSVPQELADLECAADRPLSEGEWPMSPGTIDLLQLVKDPDIRHLFEERCLATVKAMQPLYDSQLENDDFLPNEPHFEPEKTHRKLSTPSRPPAFKKPPAEVPSPLPRPPSNDHTLELVTPLPETPGDLFNSPSPPPFMGLKLEDYAFSGESVTKSDYSNDSF